MTSNMHVSPVRKRFEDEAVAFHEAAAQKRSAVDSINLYRLEIIPQMISRILFHIDSPFFSLLTLKPFYLKVIEDLKRQTASGKIEINSITEEDAKIIQTDLKKLMTNADILENGFLIDYASPTDAVYFFF